MFDHIRLKSIESSCSISRKIDIPKWWVSSHYLSAISKVKLTYIQSQFVGFRINLFLIRYEIVSDMSCHINLSCSTNCSWTPWFIIQWPCALYSEAIVWHVVLLLNRCVKSPEHGSESNRRSLFMFCKIATFNKSIANSEIKTHHWRESTTKERASAPISSTRDLNSV